MAGEGYPHRSSAPPARPAAPGRVRNGLGTLLPLLFALAALGGLCRVISPDALEDAAGRFNLRLLPAMLLLWPATCLMQALRWHLLLRSAGVRLRASQTVLLSIAGQAITAVVPASDLARAFLVSQVARAEFGAVVATVTVQTLTYTLSLLLLGAPGLLAVHRGVAAMGAGLLVMAAMIVALTVPGVFRSVHGVAMQLPLPGRLHAQVAILRRHAVALLRRPDTFSWSLLDMLRAATSVTALWLVVQGMEPGVLSWWMAAFIVAVANVGGAISLLPGGMGASDVSTVGLLVLLGVDPGVAAAAAVLQRLRHTGMSTVLGLAAYAVARRRFDIRLRVGADTPAAGLQQIPG